MKTYTKEWYLITELSRIWWWFRKDSDIHLMPVFDDSIPMMSNEVRINASAYFPEKPKVKNTIRIVPVTSTFPLYDKYSENEPEAPMQSFEKDVRCTLMNRMRIFEGLPEKIRKIIPDKRLFVLGYAPLEVKQKIWEYCNSLPDYAEECEAADNERKQILRHLTVGWQIRLKN